MSKVAVVGAGTMGNGIAHVFGQHGWDVVLIDVSEAALAAGLATIRKYVERLEKKGAISHQLAADTLGRIKTSKSLDTAKGSQIVVEAATENPGIKFEIFTALSRLLPPDTVLASNTSSISISEIAKHTNGPDKVIGMHFMNPVPVMKLGMRHPLGPLALADLIGLDVCLSIMRVLQDGLDKQKYRPAPLLEKMVTAGKLGRKSGQGFYAYRD